MSNLYTDIQGGILLATVSYDSPDAAYTYSIARSRQALQEDRRRTSYLLLQGNCHVDDARNTVVADFLASDCTDLVFLDADVSWEPEQLVELCRRKEDVIGGVYPFRRETSKYEMPVRHIRGNLEPKDGILEVDGLPTGFLKIRRNVLQGMARESESYVKNGKTIPIIFERDVFEGGRRGGDIGFCMKWREMGGKVWALVDLRLGHTGKHVVRDSLAASIRRQTMQTLKYVGETIRDGEETAETYREALKYVNNPWGAREDVLAAAVLLARKCTGPILEAGSGLSTVLMAAATDQTVWCLEHDPFYAVQTKYFARQAGVENIAIVTATIKDGWYDLSEDMDGLPDKFSLGVVDGPPRYFGDRMKFFDIFGDRCEAFLADDADNAEYSDQLTEWASQNGRTVEINERAAVLLSHKIRRVA